jgi:hypothetical protein
MLQIEFHGSHRTAKTAKMSLFDACIHGLRESGSERRTSAENLIQIMFGEAATMLGA